ncbi:hypothetical protein BDZ91DRAFT_709387 [Kalaharituber pfeilii]|nr:hypothetical protein BDZ91DRAFT_709387 [Kalaharituber pfeilii]
MSVADVRDVLELPAGGTGGAGGADGNVRRPPAKKQKTVEKRPDGITRELYALLGEHPPPVSLKREPRFKERPRWMEKAKPWEWRAFTNPARTDGLQLPPANPDPDAMQVDDDGHNTQQPELEYHFARFNIKPRVIEYSDEEYDAVARSDEWTREETDYLFELCREYDLRFPIIADRYEFRPSVPSDSPAAPQTDLTTSSDAMTDDTTTPLPTTSNTNTSFPAESNATIERSMEDIKHRYYTVTRSILALRTPPSQMSPDELTFFNLLNFDKEKEVSRKKMALTLFNRTPEEVQEEEFLLAEMKRILANQERLLEERQDLWNRLDAPQSTGSIAAYQGSQGLHNLSLLMMQADKSKKRKSVVGIDTAAAGGAVGAGGVEVGQKVAQTPTTASGTPTTGKPEKEGGVFKDAVGGRGGAGDKDSRKVPATPTTGGPGGLGSGSGATPNNTRTLTPDEERLYGVAYHEKIASGVYLRSSKIAMVKGANQPKVQLALNELGIPPKLTMATAKTCTKMEQLNQAVSALLDARKLVEKLGQEVRVEKARLESVS